MREKCCSDVNNGTTNTNTNSLLCFLFYIDTLQSQLINMGVIPTLVKLLGIHCQNAALTEMCLVAFGNLAELGKSAIFISNVDPVFLKCILTTNRSLASMHPYWYIQNLKQAISASYL